MSSDTVSIAKTLMFGRNVSLATPADCLFILEQFRNDISADSFNPLIPITGGSSLVTGGRSVEALLFCNDWLNRCHDAGINTRDAIIGLASHFDDHMGMVAMALEVASIAMKPASESPYKLDQKGFREIFEEVVVKNYGGIHAMLQKWGVGISPTVKSEPSEARSFWRKKLGHDVLMHPGTRKPCALADGTVLVYNGITESKTVKGACEFNFTLPSGKMWTQSTFPGPAT